MSASDQEFRWTLGLSLVAHAAALGVVYFSGAIGADVSATPRELPDIWVGTTVSVVEVPRERSVPAEPESAGQRSDESAAQRSLLPNSTFGTRSTAPRKVRAPHPVQPARHGDEIPSDGAARSAELRPGSRPKVSNASEATGGVNLKRAMQQSLHQPTAEAGTFGAAGVDLTERRLPRALTRALPVAIGAEPGWWKHPIGPLGRIRFSVVLSESGKLEEITIDKERGHPFHARVVQRVGKLLALGTFALPGATPGRGEQAFELELVMERRAAEADSTGEPGDLVEKGFDAPNGAKPGQAIVRDAPGHTMRAFLRLVQPGPERPTGD